MWLLRRIGGWGRTLLLLTLTLLPALAWRAPAMGPDSLPRAAWLPLLLLASYFWICARLLVRPWTGGRQPPPPAAGADPSALAEAPVDGVQATVALSAIRGPAMPGPEVEAAAGPAAEPPAKADPPSGPADPEAGDSGDLSGLRLDHAQIHMAVDEIARRVVGSSGLLDRCATTAQAAIADLDALQDEERHAQKVLVALRARLMALDQRCHALAQAALAAQASQGDRAEVAELTRAAQGQVAHCHQLAERLGAAERGHGPRIAALRRNLEVTVGQAERGLGEAQQLMLLTRKIARCLESAGRRLAGSAGPDARG